MTHRPNRNRRVDGIDRRGLRLLRRDRTDGGGVVHALRHVDLIPAVVAGVIGTMLFWLG